MIESGIKCLTDNWLLQSAAELLANSREPLTEASFINCNDATENIECNPISFGAIAIHSLASMIEQIVFCDEIFVMKEWTSHWKGISTDIDTLYSREIIKGLSSDDLIIDDIKKTYLNALCYKPYITHEFEYYDHLYQIGAPHFIGQVINGATEYMAISNKVSIAYCPHPVRAKYLNNHLYYTHVPKELIRFEKLIEKSKTKLLIRETYETELISLTTKMSSIALFCLLESSKNVSPIMTALELRSDNEFKALRSVLHEIQLAYDGDPVNYMKKMNLLEDAIIEVEKRLYVRKLGSEDGVSQITLFGFPVNVPDGLRKNIISNQHSSIIFRLLLSYRKDLTHAIEKCFGIKHKKVIQDMSLLI